MPVFKLKEDHPLYEKLLKLSDLVEELGISIDYSYASALYVTDSKSKLTYRLDDVDSCLPVQRIPIHSEFKLTITKK